MTQTKQTTWIIITKQT